MEVASIYFRPGRTCSAYDLFSSDTVAMLLKHLSPDFVSAWLTPHESATDVKE